MMPKSRKSRAFVSLQNTTFRLGERLIFPSTSWIFYQDQHWGIVGPNGSGKSWFAAALRGHIPVVQGELQYHFRPPSGLGAEELIGQVAFEDRKAEVHDTVVQSRWNSIEEEGALRVGDFLSYERVMDINPFEVAPMLGLGKAQFLRRRNRAVDLLGVAPYLERTLFSLSNGERQRVQWARALCHPLRLLILDEPFTGLDAGTRHHFHVLLERLMRTPLRVLFITTQIQDLPRNITHILEVDQCEVIGSRERKTTVGRFKSPVAPRPARLGRRPASKQTARVAKPRTEHSKPVVVIENATVRYGTKTILDGVSWSISEGESWALLGPNGSGKTTLLSLILGDHPQTYANDVAVFGRKRGQGESIWEIKRHIGWVSPELHLHFNEASTCLEVVESGFRETIGLFEPATSRQRAAAGHWLKRFGLAGFAKTPMFALSLGQQRLVLLARALVKNPRLLILDEPCQGLDQAHRRDFLSMIDRLIASRALTAIYVTHLVEEIPTSIHQVLRLARGRASIHPRTKRSLRSKNEATKSEDRR